MSGIGAELKPELRLEQPEWTENFKWVIPFRLRPILKHSGQNRKELTSMHVNAGYWKLPKGLGTAR